MFQQLFSPRVEPRKQNIRHVYPTEELTAALNTQKDARSRYLNLTIVEQTLLHVPHATLATVPATVLRRAIREVRKLNCFDDNTALQLFELQMQSQGLVNQARIDDEDEERPIPMPKFRFFVSEDPTPDWQDTQPMGPK
jgi:hypothetical protein